MLAVVQWWLQWELCRNQGLIDRQPGDPSQQVAAMG
jgi:hypothetical protein